MTSTTSSGRLSVRSRPTVTRSVVVTSVLTRSPLRADRLRSPPVTFQHMASMRPNDTRKITPGNIISGAGAGLAATVPMTVAMELMHRNLPRCERYPLPPRIITERVAGRAGVREAMDEEERVAATLVSHFGYGTVTGALYGAIADKIDAPPVAKGVAWGLAVWAGSYLGLLPALGILQPATKHPARRNALMIAAHVIWGASLGLVTEAMSDRRRRGR